MLGATTQPLIQPYATKNLWSYVRPVPGAVRVGYIKNNSNTWCTKGFNVRRNGELGFLVNSHCTRDIGFVDQVRFYQDWVGPGKAIGVETLDPAFYMGGGSCPPFATCRFSDAAYVRYGDPANSGRNTLPRITTANGRTYDDSNLRMVTGKTYVPVNGEILDKIGVQTGWTRGTVVKTCVTSPMGGVARWLKCQDYVQANSGFTNADNGDSGSPVYSLNSNGTAQARGIVWGLGGSNRYIFSNIRNIERDLGILAFGY